MGIENEMLTRFNSNQTHKTEEMLSNELDFFFDNVMESVVDFFENKEFAKS